MTGFGRILADLNAAKVRFVVVGGIAVVRHGFVRATRDVDAVVARDEENVAAMRGLLARWQATRPDGSPLPPDSIVAGRSLHLSTPHGDVDLLADRPSPLSFEELLARAEVRKVDGVPVPIVSLADLVALKRRAGRERDLLDLRSLEEAHGTLPDPPGPSP